MAYVEIVVPDDRHMETVEAGHGLSRLPKPPETTQLVEVQVLAGRLLDPRQVDEVRDYYQSGNSIASMGSHFGVSNGTMARFMASQSIARRRRHEWRRDPDWRDALR